MPDIDVKTLGLRIRGGISRGQAILGLIFYQYEKIIARQAGHRESTFEEYPCREQR
jgi:hypothetical protein